MKAPQIENDNLRVKTLHLYRILDTPPEQEFDDLTQLAAQMCQAPIAAIGFIDEKRQWFKARLGLDLAEIPRDISFCSHAIMHPDDLFVVSNAARDPRFADNPLVTHDPKIRFYASAPLVSNNGYVLGTLCVMGPKAGKISPEQRQALSILGNQATRQLEGRRLKRTMFSKPKMTQKVDKSGSPKSTANFANQFQALFERIPDGIYRSTPKGQLLMVNSALVKMLGYPSMEELLKANIIHDLYFKPEDREIALSKLFDPNHDSVVIRLKKKDGSELWVEDHSQQVFDAKGQVQYYEGVLRDVSRRQKAEDQLNKLKHAVEQSLGIVMITDRQGCIEYVNPAFELITGYTPAEVLGQNPRFLKSGIHDEAFYKNLWSTLNKGNVWSGQFTNKKKDGTLYHEEATISPVRDALGKIVHFVAVKKDITQEILLEKQLLHSQRMETIGTLAGGLAHDFNNLLTVILGNSEFGLQDCSPDHPVYADLKRIEEAGLQAKNLVNQLLSFSRQRNLKIKRLNFNELIVDLLNMVERIIGEDIELKTNLARKPLFIQGDPVQLKQVLMNLCVNARDAMPDGGILTFETRLTSPENLRHLPLSDGEVNNYAHLTITDNGLGMSKETQARIFEPFFTTKDASRGTGLGLSVVYGIIKQHHGYIEVNSEEGEGTAFRLIFPALNHHKSKVKNPIQKKIRNNEKATILIVEDEETVRHVTERILRNLGHEVFSSQNAEETVKIMESGKHQFDLVILDMVLPQSSGQELFKIIRSLQPGVPVLFVSGYDLHAKMAGLTKSTTGLGVGMLQKPFTKKNLAEKIGELLNFK
ncbi:MAG: PAS domain S-box protein [bacterium]